PLKFIVTTRGTGSQVSVSNLSAELLGGSIYIIRGKAEPGTTIRVSGRETNATTNGAFQIQVTAGAARELTVEARDSQGNSSQYKVSLSRGRT
ncbi:MAG TPA: Ig-like domain-containing protein, partial [Pyrinomonadaceae bacterium]